MQQHHLTVSRTARYCTLGELSLHTREVWFVCHGYGQLAPYFIKKFECLYDKTRFIVAPEALSRFYLEGFTGRVGATWMTREERQTEINDYVAYLNQLYQTILQGYDPYRLKIHLLGFSQASATVCRWIQHGKPHFDHLVIWAGYFANGIQDVIDPSVLQNKAVSLVYGKQDEFLTQIDLSQYENHIRGAIPHARIVAFEGGHVIQESALLQVAQTI